MWRYLHIVADRQDEVSIHTPTQGVTQAPAISPAASQQFQSTHPRRVWPSSFSISLCVIIVSIHTPTQGVTAVGYFDLISSKVSIHTPTQGVTTVLLCLLFSIPGFNPHTHAGCDRGKDFKIVFWYVSIHTPTQGVTIVINWYMNRHPFQSTHPRRVWRDKEKRWLPYDKFQSTHPRRVWLYI